MISTDLDVKCAWCGELFTKRRPNMIYCKKECCNAATNKKLIEKYHREKQRKIEKNRKCSVCRSNLSRYNSEEVCHACQAKEQDMQKIRILRELGFEYILEE
jgi:DNA-directed RNA polymerase alpha subunit